MDGFAEAMLERVREARSRLAAAHAADDAYEIAAAADEVQDALRIAHAHGLDTDAPEEAAPVGDETPTVAEVRPGPAEGAAAEGTDGRPAGAAPDTGLSVGASLAAGGDAESLEDGR